MQQHYESFSSESERASGRQDARDIWSEGEKLQAEPRRQKSMGGFPSLAPMVMIAPTVMIIFIGMVVPFVVGVLVGMLLVPLLTIHGVQAAPIYP